MSAPTICLNMIVKNEMANLERCLGAVAGHIDCWVICDTGSTDGTQDFVRRFFAERGVPGELHEFPFVNFEQARNAALDRAQASKLAFDYLLFDDADMELVVEDADFRSRLEAPGYQVMQRSAGGLVYLNTRLARRDAGVRYHGVTHEYLEVPGESRRLDGVWYKDHASGSNRADKFERDARLLTEALKLEPDNHRYWFYLAQSWRDAGKTQEAVVAYGKRAGMGGWDEEAWNAKLQQARCMRTLGDDGGFLATALEAFNMRPTRAEPLYDLARYYRDRGMNDASVLFSEPGMALPRPDGDILFLEDYVYAAGLREEFSIAANYSKDPARKDRGFAACDWLALRRNIPVDTRVLALSNLHFYIGSAVAMLPTFAARPVGFVPPDGYRPTNPSIARHGGELVLVQRAVNYTIDHTIPDGDGRHYATPDGAPVDTRNFLLRLDGDLGIRSSSEIVPPDGMPDPAWPFARGFEDMRPFAWRGALWCIACIRELTQEGWCEQVLARIDEPGLGSSRLTDWRVLHPEGPRLHEKNWMPRVAGDTLNFIYLCDPARVVDDQARTVAESVPSIAADQVRGGSQAIAFDGGWLALVHEAVLRDNQREYRHRFVWFDDATRLRGVSRPFFFQGHGVEFAAGLAWHPDGKRLIVTYGIGDSEAWIATVDAADVRTVIQDVDRLPVGVLGAAAMVPPAEMAVSAAPPNLISEPVDLSMDEPFDTITADASVAGGLGIAAAFGDRPMPRPPEPAHAAGSTPADAAQAVPLAAAGEPGHAVASGTAGPDAGTEPSTEEQFLALAPFLRAVDRPAERRDLSRAFDARIAPFLNGTEALPQIHCFYEVLSDTGQHQSLIAATTSMRTVGHPVRVWSYSPEKLNFLAPLGIELRQAADVVPRGLFENILGGSEIRYFSDLFRYALLYEHGGLWMDTDVVMLRPFPFHGDHFLNLQWRGGHKGHFICGNVMYGKAHSKHFRNLYEMSIERFASVGRTDFGDIGPKLLSDYVMSGDGQALRERLFSPMLFNSIDWTETDQFNQPIAELGDYLNDERVFGVHLWNARTNAQSRDEGTSLISLLSDPVRGFPPFTEIADRFNTDKNRHVGNRHFYARTYERLLAPKRFALKRMMEIGLCRGLAEANQNETPSVALWQSYFPFCQIFGVDLTDFSRFNNERFTSFVCDQSKLDDVRAVAAKIEPGSLDVIIDDGSHASYDQQMTFREFWPLLADGGWFFIEDLDWQPPGEDRGKIALTKDLFRAIDRFGGVRSIDPEGVGAFVGEMEEILFFDSHYELTRARLLGGLVAIRKRGPAGAGG